jgi:hypothetical protein
MMMTEVGLCWPLLNRRINGLKDLGVNSMGLRFSHVTKEMVANQYNMGGTGIIATPGSKSNRSLAPEVMVKGSVDGHGSEYKERKTLLLEFIQHIVIAPQRRVHGFPTTLSTLTK